MKNERDNLLADYQKSQREVDRILRGPIPMERVSKACWDNAVYEAQVLRNRAATRCDEAGIATGRASILRPIDEG